MGGGDECGSVWVHGDVSVCLQDCILQPILLALLVPVLCLRVVRVVGLPRRLPSASQMPLIQRLNLGVCCAVVGVRVGILVLDVLDHSAHDCVLVGNICACVAWVLAVVLIWKQSAHNKRSGRSERLWWLTSAVVGIVRFRTDIEAIKGHHDSYHGYCRSNLCFATALLRVVGFALVCAMGAFGVFQRDTLSFDFKSSSTTSTLLNPKYNLYGSETSFPTNIKSYERQASLFERLTFSWFNPLLELGAKTPLDNEHLFALPENGDCKAANECLRTAWRKHGKNAVGRKPSLFRSFISAFGAYFFVTGIFKIVNDVAIFAGPLLLNRVVSFLENSDEPMWHGYAYAAGLFLCNEIQSIVLGQYFIRGFSLGLRVRAAICSVVYQKSLVLSFESRSSFGVGRIVSLMQIDAQKICDAVPYLHLTWSSPFQLVLALYFLHAQVGVSAFAGVGVLVLLIPVNTYVGQKQAQCTRRTMESRDKRVKLVNEVVSGIRIVKMFGWENSFMDQLGKLRNVEMSWVRSNALWEAFSSFIWTSTPLFVSVVTFATFVALGHDLTASKAFTSLALFNVLRFPLNALPYAIAQWIDVSVSNKRIWEFLVASEHNENIVEGPSSNISRENAPQRPLSSFMPATSASEAPPSFYRLLSQHSSTDHDVLGSSEVVRITNASFSWPVAPSDESEGTAQAKTKSSSKTRSRVEESSSTLNMRKCVLSGVDMSVKNGSIVCIVGAVGSGKSTLLDGMLGEARCDNGQVWIRGSVAFCAQQAWIQNATVRDNILFGQEMNQRKYEQVLDACALRDDLKTLPAGDDTEIGERGINLSGGQKQRLALARACYAQADLYLLDDVLSAVDVHVGKHIVDKCLLGLLKNKTRIIATHQINWLHLADSVVVLGEGRIIAQGKFNDLVAQGIDFGPLCQTNTTNDATENATKAAEGDSQQAEATKNANSETKTKDKLVQEEEREKGVVALRIWQTYVAALGLIFFIFLCWLYLVSQGAQVFSNVWLGIWSDNKLHRSAYYYLAVYAGVSMGAAFLVYFRVLVLSLASIRAGKRIHQLVIWAVLRSPTSFFDATPIGRILNRLSQDQQTVDVTLGMTTEMLFDCISMVIGSVVSILYATPYVAAAMLPVGLLYIRVQFYYRASARELQRLDSISKSPIFVSFSETLSGLSTVRAFRKSPEFSEENQTRINKNMRAALAGYVANRWLAIRLEFLGSVIVGVAGVIAVLEHDSRGMAAGLAGLSLTYALEVTNILNWLIRVFTSTELQMVSVERLMQWAHLPAEAELNTTQAVIPPGWPSRGRVVFEQVHMRYRKNLDHVLKGVNFVVEPGQRVGIVGRTGSGKSSLLVALFRLVELERGRITIDGVDIASLGLHDIRKKISIIPQDPTLFGGTLRRNMDPFNEHTDEQIWLALRQCFMATYVEAQQQQLHMMIEPGGENLSVGQRQLVCLGRALLRRSKILVLDEATASIDGETDALIQKSLQENLADCTVLTIAHRIHTVQTSDLILVMEEGKVKEVGPPAQLLQNRDGLFFKLVHGTPASSSTQQVPDITPPTE